MTFGAWIVFAALVVFALEAIVVWEKTAGALAKRIKGFDGYAPKLARALGVVSCVLGFCVAVYTGILLMSALEHIAPAVLVHGVGAGYRRGSGGGYRAGQP